MQFSGGLIRHAIAVFNKETSSRSVSGEQTIGGVVIPSGSCRYSNPSPAFGNVMACYVELDPLFMSPGRAGYSARFSAEILGQKMAILAAMLKVVHVFPLSPSDRQTCRNRHPQNGLRFLVLPPLHPRSNTRTVTQEPQFTVSGIQCVIAVATLGSSHDAPKPLSGLAEEIVRDTSYIQHHQRGHRGVPGEMRGLERSATASICEPSQKVCRGLRRIGDPR